MPNQLPLIELLKAIGGEPRSSAPPAMDAAIADWLVRTGCAPCAWRAWQDQLQNSAHAHKLQAADVTARVLYGQFRQHAGELLRLLSEAGIRLVPLKGLSVAHRYYPEAYLRLMGDVDLLLRREQLADATAALERAGFESQPQLRKSGYADHHHTAPLYHESQQMWVELHHALLKPDFVAADDVPFNDPWITPGIESGTLLEAAVFWFPRELELAHVAAGFCLDLVEGFANERVQRNLIDATLMLTSESPPIDWPTLYSWSAGSSVGSCLLVLLGYLDRHHVVDLHDQVAELLRLQSHVDGRSLNIICGLLDQYVGRARRPGWLAQRSLPGLTRALLGKRPAWRNRIAGAFGLVQR